MENYKVFNLIEGFNKLTGFKDFKFNYAILKNATLLEDEAKLIREAIKKAVSEDMQKVVDKVEAKRAELTEEDTPVQLVDLLDEKEVEVYEEYNKSIESIMNEASSIELFKINLEDVPTELDIQQSALVMEILK